MLSLKDTLSQKRVHKFVLLKFYIKKINDFQRPLLERNYMHGSISIETISFSRNCDIKTTKCEEHNGHFYLRKVYL